MGIAQDKEIEYEVAYLSALLSGISEIIVTAETLSRSQNTNTWLSWLTDLETSFRSERDKRLQ